MSNISKLTDHSELTAVPIGYHDVYVYASHSQMENVLGVNWCPSGDGKCKTVWNFVFHTDSGESFPVSVYDWKEYDDYFFRNNHEYHIGTRTTPQAKLVAKYIQSMISQNPEL